MEQAAANVKICGITNVEDAQLAADLGAWALGMIFHDASPRSCSRAAAQAVAARLRRSVQLCGVYVNAPLEQLVADSETLGLGLLQLHGEEGPAYCAEARRRTGARVIKAARVSIPGDIRDLERYHVDFHLLDAKREGVRGGSGESFDWGLLAARRSRVPLILSGGLHPGNVRAAIELAHPYAVDVASGTEAAPGRKDPQRLRAFIESARAAGPASVGQPA